MIYFLYLDIMKHKVSMFGGVALHKNVLMFLFTDFLYTNNREAVILDLTTNLSGIMITSQCCSPTTAGAHNRIDKIFFCTSPPTWLTCKSWRIKYSRSGTKLLNVLLQCVSKKNFTLWSLNYLQAIVLIWQLWRFELMIRSCTNGNYMTLLLISSVYKTFCYCESLIWSSQNSRINIIACR